jgi:glycerol-3-phosphate acyltransferase PlsY
MLVVFGLILFAYLLGSVSFGILLAAVQGGPDLRHSGSGNIGATNVARTMGKAAGLCTLLGDGVKGLLPVLLAQWCTSSSAVIAAVALSAVVGHMFPLYYRFQGGKGVATALGVFLPTLSLPLLGGLVVWVLVVAVWHYVSAGSVLAAIVLPILAAILAYPPPLIGVALIIALLVIYKHRSNIQRLLEGTEPKL